MAARSDSGPGSNAAQGVVSAAAPAIPTTTDTESVRTGPYLRVSGDDQRRKGTIENQRPDLDRYLAAYGLSPYGWYQDEAVSGKWVPFSERPHGRRLLADATAGHVNLVLVWRLDRLGRNAYEILKAVNELEAAGARLVSLKEQFDTRTAAGRLMLGILAAVAEFEWESIMERSEAGTQRRLDRTDGAGWMGGRVPYGYRVEGKEETARLVPDETPLGLESDPALTPAGVVRLIYHMTVDQRLSGGQIAEKLNALGVPTAFALRGLTRFRRRTPTGEVDKPALHTWKADSVTSMIANTTYKGERVFGKRQRHPGHNGQNGAAREVATYHVPAIVTPAHWGAAQTVMASHQFWNVRNQQATHDYLLRGMLRCVHCGLLYAGDGVRYVCVGRRRAARLWGEQYADTHRCHGAPLPKARIEAAIWADVEHYIHHPSEAHALVVAQLSGQADTSAEIRAKLADKQQEQEVKQGERDTILTYYRTGHMTERDLSHQLDAIGKEQAKLASEIAKLTKALVEVNDVAARLASADALLADLQAQYDAEPLTPARRRAILEQFIDEMVVRTEIHPETGKPRAVVRVRYCFEPAESAGHITSMPRRTPLPG